MTKLQLFAIIIMQACMLPILAHQLCKDGKACYDIVLSKEASLSEQTAASELSQYLKQICGGDFAVTNRTASSSKSLNHIYIGFDQASPVFAGAHPYTDGDESFEYRSQGDDILIYGGNQRGTMYGVYSFMEQELGVHWYTPTFTHIPRKTDGNLTISRHLASRQQPAIPYRFDYGYDAIHNNEWCARNRLNMQVNPVKNSHGNMTAYWGAHTFQKLLPPNEYYSTHPEYFSLCDGKRIDNGQLCLSNPDVLRLVTERLERYILANPDCWGYDLSQNDNKHYCQCKSCSAISRRYGGQSGLMLWFVNQVAQAIRENHPDKFIGTFAYEYTRQAPQGIKPASNVLIRLCNIECCFLHPLDGCQENGSFLDDLNAWTKLTPNIFVWDYNVNFHYYHLPFPNHQVVARNFRLFRDARVMGILELGAYDAPWSDFSEMRQWVNAQLLWNPDLSVDSLSRTFIYDYYGPAANHIWQYYQSVCQLPTTDKHTDCHADPSEGLYTSSFRKSALSLLTEAERQTVSTGDQEILQRVRRILTQALYTRTLLDGAASLVDGTFLRLKKIIDEDPTTMRERGQTINQYLTHHGYI